MQINPKGYSQMSVANSICIYTDVNIAVIPPPFFAYMYVCVSIFVCVSKPRAGVLLFVIDVFFCKCSLSMVVCTHVHPVRGKWTIRGLRLLFLPT